MKRQVQKIVIFWGSFLPTSLAKAIYLLPYKILKFQFRSEPLRLWYRHSVYFGDIVFGLSDLDLTVCFDKEVSVKEVQRLERSIGFWRAFFPFIGEVEYYDPPFIKALKPFMNPFELRRDPVGESLFLSDFPKEREEAERIVFILNWLYRDAHKMRMDFHKRQKKIKRFCEILKIEREFSHLNELIEALTQKYFPQQKKWCAFLKDFCSFDFTQRSAANAFYEEFPEHRELFLISFPQEFIGAALHHNEFEEAKILVRQFHEAEREIFLAQIRWEIRGLMGQCKRETNILNLFIHCENLLSLIEVLNHHSEVEKRGLKLLRDQQSVALENSYAS